MAARRADTVDLWAAAKMHKEGVAQKLICDRLHLSQSVVSRLITEARTRSILTTVTQFDENNPEYVAVKDKVELLISNDLKRYVDPVVRKITGMAAGPTLRVLPDGEGPYNEAAARYLQLLVNETKSGYVGVAWGETLSGIIEVLPEREGRESKTVLLPLVGEPLSLTDPMIPSNSSSSLAAALKRKLKLQSRYLYTLPGIIPINFTKEESDIIKRFFRQVPSFQAVFGDNDDGKIAGEMKKVDVLLTSIGPYEISFGEALKEYLNFAGYSAKELEQLKQVMAADIAGVIVPHEIVSKGMSSVKDRFEECWMGIRYAHLKEVANNARVNGSPGICMFVASEKKADALFSILTHRDFSALIGHLILTKSCAEQLQRRLAAWLEKEGLLEKPPKGNGDSSPHLSMIGLMEPGVIGLMRPL